MSMLYKYYTKEDVNKLQELNSKIWRSIGLSTRTHKELMIDDICDKINSLAEKLKNI